MVTYPKDWDESKLLDHVSLVQGLTYTPENVIPTGTLVLRSSNIQNGRLSLDDNVYVNAYVPEEKMVAQGDILVCVRNGSSALIGKSCVLPELKYTTFGAFMSVLRGDTTGYFAKLFESNIVQEQVRGRSNATINQITKKDFQSIQVTVPDKPEQEEIARTLSQFDPYIDDLAELLEKKRGIRDGALEDLISGRTRLEGFEKTWSEKKLRDLCTLITKQTGFDYSNEIKASLMEYRTTNSLPFIQNKDFEGFTINFQTDFYIPCDIAIKYPKIVLDEECLLISISGRIGNVAVFNNKETAFAGGAVGVAKLIDPALATWCMLYISSSLGQEQIFANEKVGAQHNLTVEDVRNLIIKLPKSEEREAIVATIKSMDEEIEALEIERDKMIQIREGAMDDLLTGRVRLSV